MLTHAEIAFLKSLGIKGDLDNLDDENDLWADIEERVGDELEYRGLDPDYKPNKIGRICKDILNKIPIE